MTLPRERLNLSNVLRVELGSDLPSSKSSKKIALFPLLKKRFTDYTEKELYSFILCGKVKVDGGALKDPKINILETSKIELVGERWVSRGGDKLEGALSYFGLDVVGKVFLDAGSSTGGFTHCLLSNGAQAVHSVDVGYNQLHFSLRTDARVIVHEKTNVMSLTSLDPRPHGAVADLSFRSISGAAPLILTITSEKWLVALIKPQFEWKNPPDDFDGVVKDPRVILEILEIVVKELEAEGVYLHGCIPSAITGRKGNQEYLFLLKDVPCKEGQDLKLLF